MELPLRTGRKIALTAVVLALISASLTVTADAAPAEVAVPFDFNGDGIAELAIGAPGESIGSIVNAGTVTVLRGTSTGYTTTGAVVFHQGTPGISGGNEANDSFGAMLASCDFNGDRYADLAVAATGKDGPRLPNGALHILYGSRTGLTTARSQRLTAAAVVGSTGRWDRALVCGDLNGDRRADLAINGQDGPVTVLLGSTTGVTLTGRIRLTADLADGSAPTDPRIRFGIALAVGDTNGDGRDDLAVASLISRGEYWAIQVFAGRTVGPATLATSALLATDLPIAGVTYSGLGWSLALGDFDGDGYDDLAAGDVDLAPPDQADCEDRAACPGGVLVVPGSSRGLVAGGRRVWHQGSPGVPGSNEGGDAFGNRLAAGDIDGNGTDDLAVAAVGEDVGEQLNAGAATVLYGSRGSGLTSTGAQRWSRASSGVKGRALSSDTFGRNIAIRGAAGGRANLVAWAAGTAIGTADPAGSVTVLRGGSRGLTATGDQYFSQNRPGVPGSAETYDQFGVLDSIH